MVRVDVSHEIEPLEPVLIGASPLRVGLVLILRKGTEATRIVPKTCQRVLGLSRKYAPGLSSK